ncbi:E3 ubiquitin-protein ligase rnf213-alpha-like [Saccostrea cucullata]|uniref:E3 ubiquitin-protein ligase rnf213-alpha-like n=1 Tax=Saccostrea cuccullata TaxID=36930 RepID=UPI002ECFEA11
MTLLFQKEKANIYRGFLKCLENKKDRSCWEGEFADEFFSPILKDLESELKTLGKELVEDKRLGADPLLSLLYETETANEDISVHELQNHPAVWRYRSQISMDHLSKTFMMQIPANEHAVLRAFLEEEHNVRVIRLIPSILKLQKVLIHKFARKLDRSEASDLSMQFVIDSYRENDVSEEDEEVIGETESKWMEIDQLVSDFIEAWRCIRGQLGKFRFQTLKGNRQISEKYYGKDLVKEDPVSLFLPTFREHGLCSYGLLYFLLKKQNSFLEEYCRKKDIEFGKLPKVKVREITHAHLISYHPDRDLLPLVMANCQYTFEVGKGTKVEYNFANLERQLSDRFLFSKSVIDLHPKEFDLMTYRSESTNANVFRELRKKIKQVPLNTAVAKQISTEFRRYQDICDALDKLDIVIRFLQSVGGQGNTMLDDFMRHSLKMETTFLSQNMRKTCQCKHVQSLWIILAMSKTKNQATYKKDVFEGVSDTYRLELTGAQKEIVNNICEELSVERLNTMIEVLYECIVLTIDSGSENDIEDGDGIPMANYSIRDTLMVYVEDPAYDVDDTFLPDWINETLNKLPGDKEEPDCIFTCQSMDLWICLYENYSKRKI